MPTSVYSDYLVFEMTLTVSSDWYRKDVMSWRVWG